MKKLQLGDEVFRRAKMCVCVFGAFHWAFVVLRLCVLSWDISNIAIAVWMAKKKMFIQLFNVDYGVVTTHIMWHSLSVCRFFHMCNFQKQRALHIALLNRWVGFFHYFFSLFSSQMQHSQCKHIRSLILRIVGYTHCVRSYAPTSVLHYSYQMASRLNVLVRNACTTLTLSVIHQLSVYHLRVRETCAKTNDESRTDWNTFLLVQPQLWDLYNLILWYQ